LVKDNGRGIAPEFQKKVFELFHLDHDKDGVGVGLAIPIRILELHGGRIWVESRPGEGRSFRLSFPAAGDLRFEATNLGGYVL
jgi:signal transduction histidine kinase